ncbi:MAG: energy transducer TonB [Verrucomicrobiota bacterium]|nr:energy transducer TonB [Verrucomicrobiota bacterium]
MIPSRTAPLVAALWAVLLGLLPATRAFAETLPDRRPAMVGSGPGSLTDLIDANGLFQRGQRDAWVMFQCAVTGGGIVFGSDFFTASPGADLLKNEIRRRLRQARFIPAVYNHKEVNAFFAGTVFFVVANGKPHLRIYAHQELDEIKRGADFVAPQYIVVPNHGVSDFPEFPAGFKHEEVPAMVKLRHSVDANGKTTDVQVISERPAGYHLGEWLKKALPLVDFLPGYRNGRPAATSYTRTWVYGQTIGW